jgi:hypothetical protein
MEIRTKVEWNEGLMRHVATLEALDEHGDVFDGAQYLLLDENTYETLTPGSYKLQSSIKAFMELNFKFGVKIKQMQAANAALGQQHQPVQNPAEVE